MDSSKRRLGLVEDCFKRNIQSPATTKLMECLTKFL